MKCDDPAVPLAKLQPKFAAKRPAPKPKNRTRAVVALVAILVVAVIAVAYFLPSKLVTLNVRDADVQEVVRSVARQSGETILVPSDAKGNVTINVRKKPVSDVLEIITNQLGGRWQEFYAVSDSRDSIGALKIFLTDGGEAQGWRIRGFGWGAADGDEFDWIPMPDKISYEAAAKPARDVALALSLRMRSRVLVSESIGDSTVTLALKEKTPEKAVHDFARELSATTERFFSLRIPTPRQGGSPEMARGGGDVFIPDSVGGGAPPQMRGGGGNQQGGNRGGDGGRFRQRNQGSATSETVASHSPSATVTTGGTTTVPTTTAEPSGTATTSSEAQPNRPGPFTNMTEADRERFRAERQNIAAERESAWQARLDAMPPEQRARAQELRTALRDFRQNARSMTRDQRAEAMRTIVNKFPEIVDRRLERSIERIKNTTPEQRAERAQTQFERQKAREQREQAQQPPPAIPPPSSPSPR